jgi:hypothetical protein
LRGASDGVVPTGHDAHVARTFALSHRRLDPGGPVDVLAQRLLARTSFFAPGEPIPRDLLVATLRLEAQDPSALMEAEEALERAYRSRTRGGGERRPDPDAPAGSSLRAR